MNDETDPTGRLFDVRPLKQADHFLVSYFYGGHRAEPPSGQAEAPVKSNITAFQRPQEAHLFTKLARIVFLAIRAEMSLLSRSRLFSVNGGQMQLRMGDDVENRSQGHENNMCSCRVRGSDESVKCRTLCLPLSYWVSRKSKTMTNHLSPEVDQVKNKVASIREVLVVQEQGQREGRCEEQDD